MVEKDGVHVGAPGLITGTVWSLDTTVGATAVPQKMPPYFPKLESQHGPQWATETRTNVLINPYQVVKPTPVWAMGMRMRHWTLR